MTVTQQPSKMFPSGRRLATASIAVSCHRVFPALLTIAMCAVACLNTAIAEPLEGSPTGTIDGHPALAHSPRHTTTTAGHAGDAINVAFIGSEEDLHRTLAAAGWFAADPITLQSSIRIAADVVLHKPYPHAPVSDLYLWGRKQDAAFEQPHGDSPKQRHHVRFWRSREVDANAKPLWLGAATFDERVEISRTTGGITHRIGPDIDKERNKLVSDTIRVGALDGYYWVDRFHQAPEGKNGGGDPYFTDRRLAVGVINIRR